MAEKYSKLKIKLSKTKFNRQIGMKGDEERRK